MAMDAIISPEKDALMFCLMKSERFALDHYILNASGKEYYGGTWVD